MDGSSRIDELEQKFIENPRRYFAPLANEYRKAGNPHQAIAICRAHLAQLPGHMSGQIVYGQALFEGGEYEEARTVFENALAMDRENLVALRHLGDLALRSGETAAAREWYRKILELDPRDATVIALVNELDAAADAQSPAGAVEESAQQPGQPEEALTDAPVVAAEPETSHSDEEDKLISEELGYPVPPPQAFVTETMAELYLAQGFRDRALNVYRQLAALRPGDERLRAKLAELEAPAVEHISAAHPAAEPEPEIPPEARHEEAAAVELPPLVQEPESKQEPEHAPAVESHAEFDAGPAAPSEASVSGDSFLIDLPLLEAPADDVSVEAPDESANRVEPEEIAAQITVREFFAGLGRRRPSSRAGESSSNGASRAAAAAGSFVADLSGGSDARAAAQLAGAFGQSGESSSGQGAAAVAASPGKESEEDVARFRAWLDGLTG